MLGIGSFGAVWRAALAAACAAALALTLAGRARAARVQLYPVAPGNAGLERIVSGPDGALWFTARNGDFVGRITTGGQVSEYPSPEPGYSDGDNGPYQLASSGGALWYLETSGEQLYRMTTGGAATLVGDNADPDAENHPSVNLAPSAAGGVWMTSLDGYDDIDDGGVRLVDPTATSSSDFPVAYGGIVEPQPMAAGPGGSVWIGDSDHYLREVTASGATLGVPTTGTAPDEYVTSLAFDRSGNLWFTEYDPGSALSPDTDGAIGELAAGGSSAKATEMSTANAIPRSITLGPDGAMWFAWAKGVGRIDPGSGQAQLADLGGYKIADMTFGPDGNLWFVDGGANDVGRITRSSLFAGSGGGTPPPRKTKKKLPLAAAITLKVPRTRLGTVAKRRKLALTCRLAGAGRCAVTAQVTATVARGLGLKPKRTARTVTLATASRELKHKGKTTLTLHFAKRPAKRMARRRTLALRLTVTSTAARHRARTVHRMITLRR